MNPHDAPRIILAPGPGPEPEPELRRQPQEDTTVQDNNTDSGASELKAVARDVLRVGKQWAHSAQEWFDHRRQEMNNRNRDERDYESDYERDARLRRERNMSSQPRSQTGYGRGSSSMPVDRGEQAYRSGERGRSDYDIQSDYSGGGYDQLESRDYGQSAQRSYMGDSREQSDYLERGFGESEPSQGRYGGSQDYSGRNEYRGGQSSSERQYAGQRQSGMYGEAGGRFQSGSPNNQRGGQAYGQQGMGPEYAQQQSRYRSFGSSGEEQGSRAQLHGYEGPMQRDYTTSRSNAAPGGYGSSATSSTYGSGAYGAPGYMGSSMGSGTGLGYRGLGPQNYTRSDERIREDINERLTDADDIDARGLMVEVSNGIATLSGNVEQRWMKHRAEDIVENCSGVRDVRNQIQVGSSSSSTQSAGKSGTATGSSTTRTTGASGSSQGTPGI
jgi:osmotically-inducible protein OsmY